MEPYGLVTAEKICLVALHNASEGLSPIAKINNADKNAANTSDTIGTRTTSAHFGITSIRMLQIF